MVKKKLKIGFDLDGVILYNPIRFLRPVAKSLKFMKPIIFKQKKEPFYYPKSDLEKFLWRIIHKTSFRVDPDLAELKQLIQNGFIDAYLISGRYSLLKNDFEKWLQIIEADVMFKKTFFNANDIQPNLFKEQLIKKLELDIYVEDNWDIIQKLNKHTNAKILWITNFLDARIQYPYKFGSLKEVTAHLKKNFGR